MKSSALFFVVLIVGSSIVAHASLIEDFCNTQLDVYYVFCVQSLNSDPKSKSVADAKGLLSVATNVCITNVTSTHAKIVGLLKGKGATDERLRACLDTCEAVYSLAILNLKQAQDFIQSGRYNDAGIQVGNALDDTSACEGTFPNLGISSLLVEENYIARELLDIALSACQIK